MNSAEFIACSLAFHAALLVVALLMPPPFPSGGYSPRDLTYVELSQGAADEAEIDSEGGPLPGAYYDQGLVDRLAVKLPGSLRLREGVADIGRRLAAAGNAPGRPGEGNADTEPIPAETLDATTDGSNQAASATAQEGRTGPGRERAAPSGGEETGRGEAAAAIVPEPGAGRLTTGRSAVNFKYQKGWPAPAMVGMDVYAGDAGWRASADKDWIIVSPLSGKGAGRIEVGVLAQSLGAGYHEGVLSLGPDAHKAPASEVTVSVMVLPADPGTPELPHTAWDDYMDGSCKVCHLPAEVMPSADFMLRPEFCGLCHNRAGMAADSVPGLGGHPVMVDITKGGRAPTYGTVATGPYSDRPASHLLGGKVVCVTCHNVMQKPGDYGRTWELAITDDGRTYRLAKGGWAGMGYLVPKVYVTKKLSPLPERLSGLRPFMAAKSSYEYDEREGTITFGNPPEAGSYVYVTLSNPYLRAPTANNTLCYDCHTENTHVGLGCLDCHAAHGTENIMAVRESVRTPGGRTRRVVFRAYSGQGSFADGGKPADGICEVCHVPHAGSVPGVGRPAHRDGRDYGGTDCTSCHAHRDGFTVPARGRSRRP